MGYLVAMASILTKQLRCALVQASGNVSQLEAQVAELQQSLLQAKDVLHLKLQDALGARRQSEQHMRVGCGALALLLPCLSFCWNHDRHSAL